MPTQAAIESSPSGEDTQHLQLAFSEFNDLSQQLSQTYQTLEQRIAQLNEQLQEEKHQRQQLTHQKTKLDEQLQALLDFLPGGVIVLNPEGVIVQANPAAMRLLGKPLLKQSWVSVIQRAFVPRTDDGHEVSTVDGKRLGIATGAMKAEGQIILITDLTQTRELQDQLNRQERLASMGKMVSALAHQIRTPLSSAMLYASQLVDPSLQSDKQEKFSAKLFQRLQHMEHQVRDMLLFVKGDLAINDTLTLENLQNHFQQAIEALPANQQPNCIWENSNPDVTLRCNCDVLIGALMNLVNNAVQAGGEKTTLRICMQSLSTKEVSIAIKDDGPGMNTQAVNHCHDAFFTTKSQGIGLGLSVVNTVAKAHSGSFAIHSKEHQGTEAKITLATHPSIAKAN